LPAEFVVDAGGVGGQVCGLLCVWCVPARDGAARDGLDGADDIGDAAGLAAADVVGAPGAGLAGGEGAGECVGHVGDVDEVADGAAVAVDGDLGCVAVLDGEEFGDESGEVVVGTAGDCAGDVEGAEDDRAEFTAGRAVGRGAVGGEFAGAVGVGGVLGGGFGDGLLVGFAVDGAGRGDDLGFPS